MSSYTPPVRSNRINRNFQIKVHLYFNSSSHNRTSDTTPRYYLKPVALLHVENAAFTREAKAKKYAKYANNFWRYKEDTLTEAEVLSSYEKIKTSYPYGYIDGDVPSTTKYAVDVKENESFQSFYKTYWEKNLSKVQNSSYVGGELEYPHPYIEFTTNEIITQKYTQGTVPGLPEDVSTYSEYSSIYYSEPSLWACNDDVVNISTNGSRYSVAGIPHYSLKLNTSGRYRIDLVSSDATYLWPTGSGGLHSGYRFRLSTGENGTHGGYSEYTDGISYVASPEEGAFEVKVMAKTSYLGGSDDTHPYYYSGSSSGFALSGSLGTSTGINISGFGHDEGALLTLRRESTYFFHQDGDTNTSHPLYISTHPSGQSSNVFTTGVAHHHYGALKTLGGSYTPGLSGSYVKFTVPTGAPDKLYYGCNSHAYMGGEINIVNAPAATYTGSEPSESVIVDLRSNTTEKTLYYYSPEVSGMGGRIFVKNNCSSTVLFEDLG